MKKNKEKINSEIAQEDELEKKASFAKILGEVEKVNSASSSKCQNKSISTANKKERELTQTEKKRIQKLRKRQADKTFSYSDLFEVDDEQNLVPALSKDLETQDMWEDMEARILETTGCTNLFSGTEMIAKAVNALIRNDAPSKELLGELNRFSRLLREWQPRDAIEGMICSQAIACHQKGMISLKLAGEQDNIEWARLYYNSASKLFARCENSIQTLTSYRRKGEQKVVVEHVHVESGGQAIVGHVEHTVGGGKEKN